MTIARCYFLALFIATCAAARDDRPQVRRFTIESKATLWDYEWAPESDRLAILVGSEIHILEAGEKTMTRAAVIPESYSPYALAWLRDGSGFLLGMTRPAAPGEDTSLYYGGRFFTYDLKSREIVEVHKSLKKVFSDVRQISIDPQSDFWAVMYTGEGHPDVGIYKGEELLFMTDVHPYWIGLLGWRDSRLYCATGAALEHGIDRDTRRKHPDHKETIEIENPSRVYRITPQSGRAERLEIPGKDILNTSLDGKYYVVLEKQEGRVMVKLY
jgi:hypothetical protein